METAVIAFAKTGIYPCNRNAFSDDFLASSQAASPTTTALHLESYPHAFSASLPPESPSCRQSAHPTEPPSSSQTTSSTVPQFPIPDQINSSPVHPPVAVKNVAISPNSDPRVGSPIALRLFRFLTVFECCRLVTWITL